MTITFNSLFFLFIDQSEPFVFQVYFNEVIREEFDVSYSASVDQSEVWGGSGLAQSEGSVDLDVTNAGLASTYSFEWTNTQEIDSCHLIVLSSSA